MEKSIEDIWKKGFLESDALVAPQLNDLYSQKSIHIIDRFKRMFRINLIAIVVFSIVFLIVSYFVGIFITGIIFFVMLSVLVKINKHLLNGLEKVDKGLSSYQYLKAFNGWINEQIAINERMSKFLYPTIFISLMLGFWFKDAEGLPMGERLVSEILIGFPEITLIYGLPLIGIVIAFLIVGLLAYFGGRIYRWDLNIVYGRVFKKLNDLLSDVETLRS